MYPGRVLWRNNVALTKKQQQQQKLKRKPHLSAVEHRGTNVGHTDLGESRRLRSYGWGGSEQPPSLTPGQLFTPLQCYPSRLRGVCPVISFSGATPPSRTANNLHYTPPPSSTTATQTQTEVWWVRSCLEKAVASFSNWYLAGSDLRVYTWYPKAVEVKSQNPWMRNPTLISSQEESGFQHVGNDGLQGGREGFWTPGPSKWVPGEFVHLHSIHWKFSVSAFTEGSWVSWYIRYLFSYLLENSLASLWNDGIILNSCLRMKHNMDSISLYELMSKCLS